MIVYTEAGAIYEFNVPQKQVRRLHMGDDTDVDERWHPYTSAKPVAGRLQIVWYADDDFVCQTTTARILPKNLA